MKRFEIGMKVWVGEQNITRRHFTSHCYAFVKGSYNQECSPKGPEGDYDYALYFLDEEHGEIVGGASWYPASCLTFVSDDPNEYIQKVRNYSK